MKDTFRLCRKCGKPIGVIEARAYRKMLVDAEAVRVIPDPMGEQYITLYGVKVRGRETKMDETAEVNGREIKPEYAYRIHHCEAEE